MGDVAESVRALTGLQRKLFMLLLTEDAGALLVVPDRTRYEGHRYRPQLDEVVERWWHAFDGELTPSDDELERLEWLMDTGDRYTYGAGLVAETAVKLMVDAEPFYLYVVDIVTYLRDAYRDANAAATVDALVGEALALAAAYDGTPDAAAAARASARARADAVMAA